MGKLDRFSLPDELREGVERHLHDLAMAHKELGWAGRVGFGARPALIVIDLAKGWTDPDRVLLGSNLESVVESTCRILDASRSAGIPIFFTVVGYAPDDPIGPRDKKQWGLRDALRLNSEATELDPRLNRRPNEKLIVKKYASCFKGTDLQDMLQSLTVDTLIVTGCSTIHCVLATCRDAANTLRVIVPREAVGDKCELFHLVGLLDIDSTLADVVPVQDVLEYLETITPSE